MKTTIFLTEELEEKEIKRIKDLQEAKDSLFKEIQKWFLEQNEYPRITKELTKEIAQKVDCSAKDVNKAFMSVYWINNLFIEYDNDSPDDFFEDIKSINPDIIVDEEILLNRLKEIYNITSKYRIFVKSRNTKFFGAPILKSSSSSVIIKPVIEKRFEFDKQNIKDYRPRIIKKEPCVLIELNDSDDNHLYFQMDSDNFERFINDMIALQIELNSIKNDLN